MTKESVVILSGGMDSAVALTRQIVLSGPEKVTTLTFNYGSKHNEKENVAAATIAKYFKVENKLIHLPFVGDLFKSDLLETGGEVPEGHYEEENMKKTVVPFRNGIMLSIAAGYAESVGAKSIVIGSHAGDHAIYPDCRADFMISMKNAISKGTWAQIALERPFERLSKGDVVKVGIHHKTPFELTWSCYKGGSVACGRCGTCVERLEAFDEAGAQDPIVYNDRDFYREILKNAQPSGAV